MSFLAWPEIGNFHNLRKYLKQYPESLEGYGKVRYLTKVKLDGTNAAVIISPNASTNPVAAPRAEVLAQSRTKIITPSDDNMGFARWVKSQEDAWSRLALDDREVIVFGEWAGSGIQKNVAVSQISKKIFAVFCVLLRSPDTGEIVSVKTDPREIESFVFDVPNVYILPWFKKSDEHGEIFTTTINWLGNAEELQPELDRINAAVLEVEECDPWVKTNFQVEGVGEGLVFYPIGNAVEAWDKFSGWLFKAKGEKHKTVKQSAPAQANPEIANSVKEFADLVLTEARLEQGAQAVKNSSVADAPLYDMSNVGRFLTWVLTDVKKETTAELEASKLTWEQVTKAITNQARQWYLAKSKTL